ncbi:MAG: FGGY-family carbohydrate kinase [Oscillatoria sp. SIO1A7]|nr:FGGY-family carbohydrate kinase [Oscillatoria sp. SIO1A7]
MSFYLGIDFGTSGARAIAIDMAGEYQAEARCSFDCSFDRSAASSPPWTFIWKTALFELLSSLAESVRREIRSIAINGTSSTVLLCDRQGTPAVEPILYNDSRGLEVMQLVGAIAPANHPALSATSSLAKLLWCLEKLPPSPELSIESLVAPEKLPLYFLHQADWLSFLLHGIIGVGDYHNTLKLGGDPERLCYPKWLTEAGFVESPDRDIVKPERIISHSKHILYLPRIVKPGTPVGPVTPKIARQFGLPSDCIVRAGTTDSIAAFLASGASEPGEAVTSLGSTLVLKLLSGSRVDNSRYGIYSHRLEPLSNRLSNIGSNANAALWLPGGASNTGGAVLRQFFSDRELTELSGQIDPSRESPLDYYPLIKPGERFPINDPKLLPRLEPRPDNPVEFLHGLLESMARIEARGYQLLQELGATKLVRVYTAGGGTQNPVWTAIRERHLQVPIVSSVHTEAAYGTALLARYD